MNLNNLKSQPRWVCYSLTTRDGKQTKIPISPKTLKGASSTNPETWGTYEECMSVAKENNLTGVGIILNGDGLSCIDLDHCIENGQINQKALEIVSVINSYTEKSISGTGLHIFFETSMIFEKTRSAKTEIPIEIYQNKRFIVFTENVINSYDIEKKDMEVKGVYDKYFNENTFRDRIKNSYDYEKFIKLFNGDMSEFNYDHSACDLSLMNIICKYAKDEEEADNIFRQSKLNRDKYENRRDYRESLLNKAKKNIKPKEERDYLTDYEVSMLIKAKHEDSIVYDIDENSYYYYNGKYFAKDNTNKLVKCLVPIIKDFSQNSNWSMSAKKSLEKNYLSATGAKNIKDYYKTLWGVSKKHSDFNKDNELICCKNGVVNLKTSTLLPFDKKYLITNYVDIEYNSCGMLPEDSVFYKYLERTCNGDNLLMTYLQVLAGYILTGETGEQSFYYLIGPAATGKSVFVECLKLISGTYGQCVPVNCFDIKSNDFLMNMASVSEGRLVLSSEENSNSVMNTNLMKQLTGEDTIKARYLYSMPFEFKPKFKIIISTNEAPIMKSDMASMKRRLKALPFNNVVPEAERDRDLFKKLKNESEIIFSWAVIGAGLYYNQGFPKADFITEKGNEIFESQDIFSYWINDCFERDENSFISTQDLWDSYCQHCEEKNTSIPFKNLINFSKTLNQKDYLRKGRYYNMKGYFGLKKILQVN